MSCENFLPHRCPLSCMWVLIKLWGGSKVWKHLIITWASLHQDDTRLWDPWKAFVAVSAHLGMESRGLWSGFFCSSTAFTQRTAWCLRPTYAGLKVLGCPADCGSPPYSVLSRARLLQPCPLRPGPCACENGGPIRSWQTDRSGLGWSSTWGGTRDSVGEEEEEGDSGSGQHVGGGNMPSWGPEGGSEGCGVPGEGWV